MESLEFNDLQKLNQSIQQLYALHNLETFGVDALLIIDRLVPSDIPLFHITNVQTQTVQDTFLPDYPGLSPEMTNLKIQHLHEHPIAQNMNQALQGACKISDFLSPQEFHQKEGLYQEFMRPLATEDQMMLFLPSNNSGDWAQLATANALLVGFAFNRSQRSFTERDRLLLNLLRPHLFQAYCNSQKYNQLQTALHHLGIIVLDTTGKVQLITPQATTWLATYFANSILPQQLPDYLWTWVKHQITQHSTSTDPQHVCSPLQIPHTDRQLTIRLIIDQDQNRYLLLLEEQTTNILDSLHLLGLSQRETEVLALIIQGKTNNSIASLLKISPSTIRKHLENIYNKLEANSRTEAITKALGRLGFL
jgi:DNA-binding CsgD family transcriptional regulator